MIGELSWDAMDSRSLQILSIQSRTTPKPAYSLCAPGVPRAQLAYYSGHKRNEYGVKHNTTNGEPKRIPRRQQRQPTDAEIVAVVSAALACPGAPIPWSELGYPDGGPVVAGREVDLRRLWTLVSAWGGMDGARAARRWTAIAIELGAHGKCISNFAAAFKTIYTRFLLPYEAHWKAGGGGTPEAAKKEAKDVAP